MNNYIILNGVNSNTITGLIISSLPPISKPLMRTNIETIDGKDGDIITKLGYSAYDKEITIGLSYNYNVDDVIKYFNSEGTVIFSNEPTKYYKYTILDQIDFERLIRFKTATVRMHVQPFKYSTTEEDIEENATETDAEGTNFTLENTENGAGFIDLKLKGDTFQETTEGYNLFKNLPTTETTHSIVMTNDGKSIKFLGTNNSATHYPSFTFYADGSVSTDDWYPTVSNINSAKGYFTNENTQYIFSLLKSGTITESYCTLLLGKETTVSQMNIYASINTYTQNIDNNSEKINFISIGFKPNQQVDIIIKPQLELGSTAHDCEPYTNGPSPNPNYPQNIDVVTGENTVTLSGKNDLNNVATNRTLNGLTFTINDDKTVTVDGTATADTNVILCYYTLKANTNYYLSGCPSGGSSSSYNLQFYSAPTQLRDTGNGLLLNRSDDTTGMFRIQIMNGTACNNLLFKPMLEKNTTATSYQPYHQSQSYTLSLGDIELCKLGDYQDYIYPANNTWYIHKEVAKVIFNGSETWGYDSQFNYFRCPTFNFGNFIPLELTSANKNAYYQYSNRFIVNKSWSGAGSFRDSTTTQGIFYPLQNVGYKVLFRNTDFTTTSDFANWLNSNNTNVYYQLATPIDTEITDETLLSQLNELKGATTYEGQTNIITAGDLQPIIYVKTFAMDNPSYTVTNSGNYFAKPVMTIYGIGTVGVYLDGVQVLSLALNENQTDHITIDVPNMNAYTDTINTLRNRAVIGDYNNLKFNVGDNELSFSGTIQGFIIQNYSRWL